MKLTCYLSIESVLENDFWTNPYIKVIGKYKGYWEMSDYEICLKTLSPQQVTRVALNSKIKIMIKLEFTT